MSSADWAVFSCDDSALIAKPLFVRDDPYMLLLLGLTVLAGLIGAGLSGVTITVFLHRGITHGSIRMSRPVYEVGRWMAWFTTFMRHWEWRRVHRKHHLYTDQWIDEIRHDPHSPIVISEREQIDGYRRVSWHMAALFHAEAKLPDIRDDTYELSIDRPLDRLDHVLFDRPVLGATITGIVYATLFGIFAPAITGMHRSVGVELACLVAGVLALGVHIMVMLRFGGAINSDCHRGKTVTEGAGYAVNVRALSILIFGEGEHLSHHLNPQVAQISRRFDLGWRVIQVLRTFGLVTVTAERSSVPASREEVLSR
jgi:fatty-acid desaturase